MCLILGNRFISDCHEKYIHFSFDVNLQQDTPDDCFTSMEGRFKDLKP